MQQRSRWYVYYGYNIVRQAGVYYITALTSPALPLSCEAIFTLEHARDICRWLKLYRGLKASVENINQAIDKFYKRELETSPKRFKGKKWSYYPYPNQGDSGLPPLGRSIPKTNPLGIGVKDENGQTVIKPYVLTPFQVVENDYRLRWQNCCDKFSKEVVEREWYKWQVDNGHMKIQ